MQNKILETTTNRVIEWDYISLKSYEDPFDEIELDVQMISEDGEEWLVPAFWRGGQKWSVRFTTAKPGVYKILTFCSDDTNHSLHKIKGQLNVLKGNTNDITQHYISLDNKNQYLKYQNNKPFFWLADTWWMGLSNRLSYPKDFKQLTQDRKEKGFTVIQLVAGLFPDMHDFDKRAANEGGLPWEENYAHINPNYFDKADERIIHLCDETLVPCILGAWGYYIHSLGDKKMKQHWRYIVARWGAYPVVWCIAGEAAMPFYLSKNGPKDMKRQIVSWTRIGEYIKTLDPFHRLMTIHPTDVGRKQVKNDALLDVNMLQAGHNGYASTSNAIKLIYEQKNVKPFMPTIMAEVNYEGIIHNTSAEVQRVTFWSSILSGAIGYSYGANGIWQVNQKGNLFGASPHGGTWGNKPWDEACKLEGATHLGLAKNLLKKFEWWKLTPNQSLITPQHDLLDIKSPRVATIESCVIIIYFYGPIYPWDKPKYKIIHLNNKIKYTAYFWDPRTSEKYPVNVVKVDTHGHWEIPTLPTFEDWILIIEHDDTPIKVHKKRLT